MWLGHATGEKKREGWILPTREDEAREAAKKVLL